MSLKASELLSRILYRVGGCDQRWTPVCCVYYKGLERGGSLVERREAVFLPFFLVTRVYF